MLEAHQITAKHITSSKPTNRVIQEEKIIQLSLFFYKKINLSQII